MFYGSEGTADHVYIDDLPNSPTKHSMYQPPDADEVTNIIKKIQFGKAAGEDEISGELLKAGIDLSTESILHLINTCWSTKTVPQDFKTAKITTFHKNKGEKGDCNNYRGISLLSFTGKVPAKVLNRLQQLAEDIYPESQCGFRAQRSTTDMIFVVRQLQKNSVNRASLTKLTKALDLVDRRSQRQAAHPLYMLQSSHSTMGCKLVFSSTVKSLATFQ